MPIKGLGPEWLNNQQASIKVAANPGPMELWGLIVAGGLVIGSIPAFLGLIIIMPVLGHATWHPVPQSGRGWAGKAFTAETFTSDPLARLAGAALGQGLPSWQLRM